MLVSPGSHFGSYAIVCLLGTGVGEPLTLLRGVWQVKILTTTHLVRRVVGLFFCLFSLRQGGPRNPSPTKMYG